MNGATRSVPSYIHSIIGFTFHVAHLTILGGLIWPLLFRGLDLNLPLKATLMALALVSIRLSACVPLFLLLQIGLLLHEPTSLGIVEGINQIAFVCMATALLMHASQYHELHRAAVHRVTGAVPRRNAPLSSRPQATAQIQRDTGWNVDPWSIIPRALSRSLIFALLAQLILLTPLLVQNAPLSRQATGRPVGSGLPSVEILVAALAAVIVLRELLWRQLTNLQAQAYMRSTVARLLFGDLRLIAMRKLGLRRGAPKSNSDSLDIAHAQFANDLTGVYRS